MPEDIRVRLGNLKKSNFVRDKFLKIRSSINLPMGSHEVPKKIWARSVQAFWRLLDTNKQTDRQAKYIFTRLLFYLSCEHGLFVYIFKLNKKKFRGFWKFIGNRILLADFTQKKFADFQNFQNFYKNKNFSTQLF